MKSIKMDSVHTADEIRMFQRTCGLMHSYCLILGGSNCGPKGWGQREDLVGCWASEDMGIRPLGTAAMTPLPGGGPISWDRQNSRRVAVECWDERLLGAPAASKWPLVPDWSLRSLAHANYHANPNYPPLRPPQSHNAIAPCSRGLARCGAPQDLARG